MLRNQRSDDWIQSNLQAIFDCTRLQPADAAVLALALELRQRHHFSFWDCQIAAAAIRSGSTILLSGYLQNRQLLEGRLTVINPFAEISKP